MSKIIKKPSWWEDFKTFAIKGNAMALAVGTIIGGAFSTITKSLTNDIIMPIVNIFLGGADFSEIKIRLPRMPWVEPTYELVVNEAGEEVSQIVENYLLVGNLISAIINFTILAMVVFWLVRGLNKLDEISKKKELEAAAAAEAAAAEAAAAEAAAAEAAAAEAAAQPPVPTAEEVLLTEIRDLLKNK